MLTTQILKIIRNKNIDKEEKKENYFSCSFSPFYWELSDDPYNDVRRKKIPFLKNFYSTMADYRNVIEPLFHIECKESLRQFNEKLNKKISNLKENAVKLDVINVLQNNNNNNLEFYLSETFSIYNIILSMPNYFLLGYDGMNYSSIVNKNKEKRSSGPVKKLDLLYLAKVNDDFTEKYFETLMFFDTIKGKSIESLQSDNLSSSSSFLEDDDEDELKREIKLMEIAEGLEPEDQLITLCKCRMKNTMYQKFLTERNRERGQWIGYHIMSFGPIRKEYNTLMTLTENPSLPICNIITSGRIGNINQFFVGNSNNGSEDITNYVIENYHLNPSQSDILKKVRNRKFSLVQGPPGTGKTTTIIAIIIRALLESIKNSTPFKVLVCAPSNHACDEISRRLEKENIARSFRYKADDNLTEDQLKEKLKDANVVVCTLCCSGNSIMKEVNFDLLIIDEACQCTELTALIPFCYNIKQSILIGDPKQLPPTIKSYKVEKCGYGKSLFERIQEGSPSSEIYLLNTQYRMHPDISKLSSKCFYEGKIIDGPNVQSTNWIKKWIKSKDSNFGPVRFYNVKGFEQNYHGSFCNEEEVKQVVNFISDLLQTYPDICFHNKISIISPYSAQVYHIKRKLKEMYKKTLDSLWMYMKITNDKNYKFYNDVVEIGSDERYKKFLSDENIFDHISVSTVDSFQGQENDIVIISTVRSNGEKIGFLKDRRRLNVSISRSRYSLIIFGDSSTLITNNDWKNIITEIKNMGSFKYDKNFNDSNRFPSNLLPKTYFESLKKKIEYEKRIEKEKKILLDNGLEFEISNDFIIYYNVPTYSSKNEKLDKNKILMPSHIIGSVIQKIVEYDMFNRLEPFSSKIITSIKNTVSKNAKDKYFWLSNAFELKCVVETIHSKENKLREKKDAEIVLNVLNNLNDLIKEIYDKIWKSLHNHIIKKAKLEIIQDNDNTKDIFYYLSSANKKFKYFYIEDSIGTQTFDRCIELIYKSWLNNYNEKKRNSNLINNQWLKELFESKYKQIVKQNKLKLKSWCNKNNISDNIKWHIKLLKATSMNNSYYSTDDNDLINSFNELRINEDATTSKFEIPKYKEVKKLKVSGVPDSAFLTSSLFEV